MKTVADVLAAFEFVLDYLARPGEKLIVPTPAYYPLITIPARREIDVIEVPMSSTEGRWVLDVNRLQRAFDEGGKWLVLCDPHNPTGTVMSRQELLAVASLVEHNGGRVFSDLVHAPIRSTAVHPYAGLMPQTARHAVTAISPSKAWNTAGLKAAQMVLTNDDDLAVWERVGPRVSNMASSLGVIASAAAYGSEPSWLNGLNAYIEANRALAEEVLDKIHPALRASSPQAGYFEWLNLAGISATLLKVEKAGVALSAGGPMGTGFEGYGRLNVATRTDILERILDRLTTIKPNWR